MGTSDWIALAGVVIAAVSLAWAIHVGRRSDTKIAQERRQRERQSEALERIAAAAERNATRTPSDLSVPAPAVEWQVENPHRNVWVLRNLGPSTAHNVTIDKGRLGGGRVDISGPNDLTPMASKRVTASEGWGPQLADEMWVACTEHQPRPVPMPRWF